MADNDYEFLQYQMKLEIEKLSDNVKKYTSSIENYENTLLIQSKLLIENSIKSHEAGEIGNTEYILISSKAFEIEQKYNELLRQYNRAVLELNKYLVNRQ